MRSKCFAIGFFLGSLLLTSSSEAIPTSLEFSPCILLLTNTVQVAIGKVKAINQVNWIGEKPVPIIWYDQQRHQKSKKFFNQKNDKVTVELATFEHYQKYANQSAFNFSNIFSTQNSLLYWENQQPHMGIVPIKISRSRPADDDLVRLSNFEKNPHEEGRFIVRFKNGNDVEIQSPQIEYVSRYELKWFVSESHFLAEIDEIEKNTGEPVSEIVFQHTHPAYDYFVHPNKSDKSILYQAATLSPADLYFALEFSKLTPKTPFVVEAITPQKMTYSVAAINGGFTILSE